MPTMMKGKTIKKKMLERQIWGIQGHYIIGNMSLYNNYHLMIEQAYNFNIQIFIKAHVIKNLNDRSQDKRNLGRRQLESVLNEQLYRSRDALLAFITFFETKFLKNKDINKKLIGLEIMKIMIKVIEFKEARAAYNEQPVNHLQIYIDHKHQVYCCILKSLKDCEVKMRLLALKLIWQDINNKQLIFQLFVVIFEKIIVCNNDQDQNVKRMCNIVNQDLVKKLLEGRYYENKKFKVFINIIKLKLKTNNFETRNLLLFWIKKIITLQLLIYFPQFLEDLLIMISQGNIAESVEECLSEFKRILQQKFIQQSLEHIIDMDYINTIIVILIRVSKSKYPFHTKYHTLDWFRFIFDKVKTQCITNSFSHKGYFKKAVIEKFDEILEPILLLQSHQQEQVRKQSKICNDLLMECICKIQYSQPINFIKVIPILKQAISQKKTNNTTQNGINWMKFMFQDNNVKISEIKEITEKLIQKIYETNNKKVLQIVEIMKKKDEYCNLMIHSTIELLIVKLSQKQNKMAEMIKKFISEKNVDYFMKLLCCNIKKFGHKKMFMYEVGFALVQIIIVDELMIYVRKAFQKDEKEYYQFFDMYFQIMKFNPSAAILLCFLARQYQLALCIINTLNGCYEISPNVLIHLSKMIILLEKPTFLFLRMQLAFKNNQNLLECLNTLLLILPQGKIFNLLKTRLDITDLIRNKEQRQMPSENKIDVGRYFSDYKNIYGIS